MGKDDELREITRWASRAIYGCVVLQKDAAAEPPDIEEMIKTVASLAESYAEMMRRLPALETALVGVVPTSEVIEGLFAASDEVLSYHHAVMNQAFALLWQVYENYDDGPEPKGPDWFDLIRYPDQCEIDWQNVCQAIRKFPLITRPERFDTLIRQESAEARRRLPALPLAAKPKRSKRRIQRKVDPKQLTAKQAEAVQAYGDSNGNIPKAARRCGISPRAMRNRLEGAWVKIGKRPMMNAIKAKTKGLPMDRRSQEDVADVDDQLRDADHQIVDSDDPEVADHLRDQHEKQRRRYRRR